LRKYVLSGPLLLRQLRHSTIRASLLETPFAGNALLEMLLFGLLLEIPQ
jgi:hypothetical protein